MVGPSSLPPAGVVEHHVEDDLDAGRVQPAHGVAHLVAVVARLADR
jgi:hypothetical protein